jgi:rhodanese-related sulfurtransferase
MDQLVDFADNNKLLALGLLASWAAVMFYELRLKATTISQVSPADAVRVINKGAMIIDVRSIDAYESGRIVNARNITLEALETGQGVHKNKNKFLLAVCENGMTSGKAANVLRKAGFENVFSLKGGLKQWRSENLPLVK